MSRDGPSTRHAPFYTTNPSWSLFTTRRGAGEEREHRGPHDL